VCRIRYQQVSLYWPYPVGHLICPMNSKVHPLVVVVVLVLTLVAVGIWIWGSGESKAIGGPAELRTDPAGHLYIQVQNQLLEHDADGAFLTRHDLGKLVVETVLGSVAFFSDGDILLRRGPDPRSLSDNVRAYQRLANKRSLVPESPDSGLFRCKLRTSECVLFGTEGIDFKAVHNIFIDWRSDEVYITDTTRHLLRKYSADGEPLAEPVSGFKFPNQLLVHNDRLFIANTNHHEISIVDSRTEYFGKRLGAIDVVPAVASRERQTWPSHIARVGDKWWVNNMRTGMNEGGIYIFDDLGHYDRRVGLPRGADPISVLLFRDEVLVSDWNNDRIYRVSAKGDLLTDFASPGLEQVLEESRTKRRQFEMFGYSGIALFFFVVVGLLVRGLAATMSRTTPP